MLLTPSTLPLQPNGKDTTVAYDKDDKKTEVHSGIEYAINRTLQTLSTVKYRFDNYGDVKYPSIIITTE